MALIPFMVLFAAYQLGWYGYTTIKPICKVGFTDLLLPSQMAKVDGFIKNAPGCQTSQPNSNAPSSGAQPAPTTPGGALIT